MSPADRAIRIGVAACFAALFFTDVIVGTWGIILISVATILLVTSVIGNCPLYTVLGINTCKRNLQ